MYTASIAAALSAAVSFALAAVFQQEAARTADPDCSLSLRLLLILLRRAEWRAGVGLLLCGYGLQALALANGPVALVQPLVATELSFAVPISIWRRRSRAKRRDWAGILAVLAGVSTFLWIASPASGRSQPDAADWVACLVPVGAAIAVLLTVASRVRGPRRAVFLGAAAGLAFALLAVLTKAVTHNLGVSVPATFANWEVYALIGFGISALVISQSAYQAGPLALSMPAIALLEPAVAVVIGDTAFSEQANLAGWALAGELLAAAVAAAGLIRLATSPTVIAIYEQAGQPATEPADAPPGQSMDDRRGPPAQEGSAKVPDRSEPTRLHPTGDPEGRAGHPCSGPAVRGRLHQGWRAGPQSRPSVE